MKRRVFPDHRHGLVASTLPCRLLAQSAPVSKARQRTTPSSSP